MASHLQMTGLPLLRTLQGLILIGLSILLLAVSAPLAAQLTSQDKNITQSAVPPTMQNDQRVEQVDEQACQSSSAHRGGNKDCLNAISALYRGFNGRPDYIAARRLSERACSATISEGCNFLGAMQQDGSGGPKDVIAADDSFERACLYGSGGGIINRAQMIVERKSPVKDMSIARDSYRKACDKNVVAACNNYGAMLLDGEGGSRDPISARAMFDTACGAGNIDA